MLILVCLLFALVTREKRSWGSILTIAPGRGAIAVRSPGLNEAGTSLVGAAALEHFTRASNWSVFD